MLYQLSDWTELLEFKKANPTMCNKQQQIFFLMGDKKIKRWKSFKNISVNHSHEWKERKGNIMDPASNCKYKRNFICTGLEKSNLVPDSISHNYNSVHICEHNAC